MHLLGTKMFDERDSALYLPFETIGSVRPIGTFCGWNITQNADDLVCAYEHRIGTRMFFSVFPTDRS